MPTRIRSTKELDTEALAAAQKVKPKLRKFVVDQMVSKAAENATTQRAIAEEMLANREVLERASKLSMRAFLDDTLWREHPLPIETHWIKLGVVNEDLRREMMTDIAGFSSFLVREYQTFKHERFAKRGYLNPMNDDNLPFFWQKFCADLRLLIGVDSARVALGKQGIVVVNAHEKELSPTHG